MSVNEINCVDEIAKYKDCIVVLLQEKTSWGRNELTVLLEKAYVQYLKDRMEKQLAEKED